MDYTEVKHQIVTEVTESLMALLHEIEPEIITAITNNVKAEYEQKLLDQKLEINELKERIKTLEESISWAAYKLGVEL